MREVVDSKTYIAAMMDSVRPGISGVQAFYEHRIGKICVDPKLMLMPWDDHLVHRGDGVFEAMKFVGGKVYQLDQHLKRMQNSCKALFLDPPCTWEDVREIVLDVCRAGGKQDGAIRIFIGRGPGGFGISPYECPVPSLYVVASDLHKIPEERYEKGVTAFKTSIPAKQPWLAKIKSIDYLPNVLMKREAVDKGYDYPFCFDEHDFLAEGATENVCIVDQQGKLHIPEFTHSLPGTTMMRVIDLIKGEIDIMFRGISEHEIHEAKEVIVCGTTSEAISVVRFNSYPIHDVRPGPVQKRMRELLQKDLRENGVPF